MKKHLSKILFTLIMIVGFSLTVSAQKQDKDKDKPPRRDLPKIVVPKSPKPPKDDKDEDKKPKPEMYSRFVRVYENSDLS